jgi:hypothetical protein
LRRNRLPFSHAIQDNGASSRAADVMLLIGGQGVVDAAADHMQATFYRLETAWRGEWQSELDAYEALNNAMRNELLQPIRP